MSKPKMSAPLLEITAIVKSEAFNGVFRPIELYGLFIINVRRGRVNRKRKFCARPCAPLRPFEHFLSGSDPPRLAKRG